MARANQGHRYNDAPGPTKTVTIHFPKELIAAIDEWRLKQLEPWERTTAIRLLVRMGLKSVSS